MGFGHDIGSHDDICNMHSIRSLYTCQPQVSVIHVQTDVLLSHDSDEQKSPVFDPELVKSFSGDSANHVRGASE
jgi:hypothetical protein